MNSKFSFEELDTLIKKINELDIELDKAIKNKKIDVGIVKSTIKLMAWAIYMGHFRDNIKLDFDSIKSLCGSFKFQAQYYNVDMLKSVYCLDYFNFKDALPVDYRNCYSHVYYDYFKSGYKFKNLFGLLEQVEFVCSEMILKGIS